jgi:3D-(3,5/4)-trihydroxycyclohexane-1,2-dione acylhydrolase (decyclizing)
MATIRLTMAQALVRYLAAQRTECDDRTVSLFGGVWAIFGHGNVAGMGEALAQAQDKLPTFRAHNEQAMAHAAIAFAKASRRRRMMACTTSIGPGATNMVTAAALAHVNRLPVLLLPGDVFAGRRPDPVLQQIEDFGDGTVSANDCFRPVSRYFDRITRPEQIITALQRAMAVLTDPAECGPVTLALCQDVQAEAFDYPEVFFAERIWTPRRVRPSEDELSAAIAKGPQAADHRRRRRALFRRHRNAEAVRRGSSHPPRRDRRRPASPPCLRITRSTWARSVLTAARPRIFSRNRRT